MYVMNMIRMIDDLDEYDGMRPDEIRRSDPANTIMNITTLTYITVQTVKEYYD